MPVNARASGPRRHKRLAIAVADAPVVDGPEADRSGASRPARAIGLRGPGLRSVGSRRPAVLGRALALGLGCAGLFIAQPALARGDRNDAEPPPSEPIAVTRLPFQGIAGEVAAELENGLLATLRRHGFAVRTSKEVENVLATEQRLLGCTTASCYGRLAQVLGVRRVLEGEVQRLELSTFAMRLQLRDLFTGQLSPPQPVQERCDVCSNDDVRQMVARAAERLAQAAPPRGPQEVARPTPTSGILTIETEPPGAKVSIDGTRQNEATPASYLLAVGVHNLVVEGAGYRPLRQQVEIRPGEQPVTMRLSLSALAQRRPWLTALAVVSALGAVGLIAGGGYLISLNEKPVNTDSCPDLPGVLYRCPTKYSTLLPGGLMVAGGGVLAIGAGLMFYLDRRSPQVRATVDPSIQSGQSGQSGQPGSSFPSGSSSSPFEQLPPASSPTAVGGKPPAAVGGKSSSGAP